MTVFSSFGPNLAISPFSSSPARNPLLHHRNQFGGLGLRGLSSSPSHSYKPFLRGTLGVPRFGFKQVPLTDPDTAEGLIRDLFSRAEGFLYTIADAAVSASSDPGVTTTTTKQSSDWLSGITNYMETVLKFLKGGLSALHVPYSYGFAIILLTVLVKAATFPLTKKQVESTMAMRSLQPQIKAIQQQYAGDKEKIQLETARLYKLAGINPLAGCLPTLATIPVWIGLYRALSNVADEGLLTEGFFWIPSLAGPTTVAARQSGSGISWIFPFVDGQPPLGWSDTLAYLVLPVLLVLSQYISVQIMQSSQNNDPNLKTSQAITKFLPLMIGYFALSVPSGLSLYWLTNNILSTGQQVWLQKLGGANNPVKQFSDDIRKEEKSQIPNSVKTTVTEVSPKAEKTVEGPQRGERFKQLKEQEARKRQQREEERRKAEAAAKGIQTTNGELKKEADLVEIDRTGAELLDANSVTTVGNNTTVVNRDGSQDSKEDQRTSEDRVENSELYVNNNNGSNHHHLYKNTEKEETAESRLSGEEAHQDRRV